MGSASNQLDTVERMNPVTETAWTPLPSLINKRKRALRPVLSKNICPKQTGKEFAPRISKENQSFCCRLLPSAKTATMETPGSLSLSVCSLCKEVPPPSLTNDGADSYERKKCGFLNFFLTFKFHDVRWFNYSCATQLLRTVKDAFHF
jgi:hypothetical protein